MKHLSAGEVVDLVEGTLEAARAAHTEFCDRCRARAKEVSAAASAARSVQVPEPSPLFWEQFSLRVRQAVADEPMRRTGRRWLPEPGVSLAGGLVIAALVVATVLLRPPLAPEEVGSTPVIADAQPDAWLAVDEDDDSWTLVVTVAGSLDWDQASDLGLSVRPGSADSVLLTLSAEERSALARLLQGDPPGSTS